MATSYKRLWKQLIDKTDVIARICLALDCTPDQIILPDEPKAK